MARKRRKKKTVWDKLFVLNFVTCSIIILIGMLLILLFYFIK